MADRLITFDSFLLWGDDEDPGLFRDLIARAEGRQPVREPAFEWIIRNEVSRLSSPRLFDLGANIGYYAQVMAQEAKGDWHLLCAEPDTKNWQYLMRNTAGFKGRCTIQKTAVGDHTGAVRWQESSHSNCGRVNHPARHSYRAEVDELPVVTCQTLGDFLHFHVRPLPNFIKMDIEGGELAVFRGARDVLCNADTPCKILVEVHQGEWRENPAAFRAELEHLIDNGWKLRYVVSAHTDIPQRLKSWEPCKVVSVPGKVRAIYEEFPLGDALHYLSMRYEDEPAKRVLRAFMLENGND